MRVPLPDGSVRELPDGSTGADLAADIGPGLARAAMAIRVLDGDKTEKRDGTAYDNGRIVDLSQPLVDGQPVEIVTAKAGDGDALKLLRHDIAHVLAESVLELYPGTKVSIGPPIADGFYYDFEFPPGVTINEDDFPKIEAQMRKHVKAPSRSMRSEVTHGRGDRPLPARGPALQGRADRGPGQRTRASRPSASTPNGEFLDLCRGPHAPDTGRAKAFKLTSVAGAYWRGDANRQMLTRIYGTAFATKDELAEHLERLEQARARDHRKLGKELELYMFSELSPGSPFWFPNGMAIWNELTKLWREENGARGYREVKTPILYDAELFKRSGHWHVYRDNMYFTDVEGQSMGLKPMNCPAHTQLYASQRRSYRDLPIRYSEQGLVHRHEPSGTLHGLLRVRHITQDDAHIFATEDQIEEEVIRCLDFGFAIYDRFGFEPRLELSTRPEKRIGTEDMWDRAEAALQRALDNHGLAYEVNEGDGAFYGPEDRPAHDRRDRPLVAAGHGPARLRDAGALRAHLHGRRQRRAPPGDDPPRADGLLRALHRHARRALRGRVPGLAGAGPGDRAAGLRPPRRARRQGPGGARGVPRRGRPADGVDRAQDPRGRAAQDPVHARRSATARSSRTRCRCAGTARATRARCRSTTSAPSSRAED